MSVCGGGFLGREVMFRENEYRNNRYQSITEEL